MSNKRSSKTVRFPFYARSAYAALNLLIKTLAALYFKGSSEARASRPLVLVHCNPTIRTVIAPGFRQSSELHLRKVNIRPMSTIGETYVLKYVFREFAHSPAHRRIFSHRRYALSL